MFLTVCGLYGTFLFPCTHDLHASSKYQGCLIFYICYRQGLFVRCCWVFCCGFFFFSLYIKYLGGKSDSWLKLNSEGIINPRGFLGATCRSLLNCKPTFTNNYNIGFAEITHNDFNQGSYFRTQCTLGPSK